MLALVYANVAEAPFHQAALEAIHLLELLAAHSVGGKQIHDANIVATMLAWNIPKLLTHNVADFSSFNGLIQLEPLG